MRQNESLAVVIVAKNQAARIGESIASGAFADEVLVLDSGSTDRTAAIAAAAGARVSSPTGRATARRARGFRSPTSDWALSLDADERITGALRAEIVAAIASGAKPRLSPPALVGVLRQGAASRRLAPDYTLRLGRRSRAASPPTSSMRT